MATNLKTFLQNDKTIAAVNAAMERRHLSEWHPRDYIGFSGIGHECDRKLWRDYNFKTTPEIKSNGLRAIQDGFHCEDQMAERLRLVDGIELYTEWPVGSGNQIEGTDHNGKFAGHLDGIIKGILEAPNTWHVWEHKAVNEEKFDKLTQLKAQFGEKKALEQWDYIYYCQAVLYMHYKGLTRHYLTVDSPGGRNTTSCRTNENPRLARALREKAGRLLGLTSEPEKISKRKDMLPCAWCDHKDYCHGE